MIIIDGIIFTLQKSGGISVYFYELLQNIQKKNESISLILYENDNNYTRNDFFTINSKIRKHIAIERFRRVNVIGSYNDIFHSSYYRLPSKKFKGKIITTVHDFTEEIYPRGIISKILYFQKRKAILDSDGLICISENTRRDMHRFIPESVDIPTKVIYNGVADFFHNNLDGNYERFVIFVGARGGYKNFEMCVLALKNLRDIRLVVVGGGDFSSSETRFLNDNIHGRFAHMGFVTLEKLNELYQKALALVYPSEYEGFGIPVIEAMKSGCPVIAAETPAIQEVSNGSAVLIANISAEKIEESIRNLENHKIRVEKIQLGIENSKIFSWDKMAEETLNFYNEIRGIK